jgi:hypothetical protein
VPDALLTDGQRLALRRPAHGQARPASAQLIIDVPGGYETSIKRLRKLPIVTAYPGHGQPFSRDELSGVL